MSLTDAQKVKVRYHLGFPMFGGQSVQAFGYRFMAHYGTLEFRMNNLLPDEQTKVVDMLTSLDALEAAIDTAGDNMDTDVASVWERNKNELGERERLYLAKRRRLSRFFGVPLNDDAQDNTVALVV